MLIHNFHTSLPLVTSSDHYQIGQRTTRPRLKQRLPTHTQLLVTWKNKRWLIVSLLKNYSATCCFQIIIYIIYSFCRKINYYNIILNLSPFNYMSIKWKISNLTFRDTFSIHGKLISLRFPFIFLMSNSYSIIINVNFLILTEFEIKFFSFSWVL